MVDRRQAGAGPLIRKATAADAPFVIAAGTAAFAVFGDYDPILRAFLAQDDVTAWIADAEGAPAGFALVERPRLLPGFADLVAIAVAPEHRRRGIAAALLGAVVADAEGRGEPLLALTVAEDNAPAIALFTRFGFRMIPGSSGHYAGGQRSRRMVRPGQGAPQEMPKTR